jgi:hypothetical protein
MASPPEAAWGTVLLENFTRNIALLKGRSGRRLHSACVLRHLILMLLVRNFSG